MGFGGDDRRNLGFLRSSLKKKVKVKSGPKVKTKWEKVSLRCGGGLRGAHLSSPFRWT